MAFGALVAVVGLALLYFRKEQAENKIKFLGQEFEISTPALVVFLVGCAIFVLPTVIPMQSQTVIRLWARDAPDGPQPTLVGGEEHEPNNQITEANLITMGKAIKGVITTSDDRDFFKFKTGQGMNTRIIVRKTLPSGFNAQVTIYNNAEERVASGYALGEDAVSFAFGSNPGSFYYVLVEGMGGPDRGPYELLIKEEQ